jgi:hypothetical protein
MRLLALVLTTVIVAGCTMQPDPPPHFAASDFSGTGTEMAKCMQYSSQSNCETSVWGGQASHESGASNSSR